MDDSKFIQSVIQEYNGGRMSRQEFYRCCGQYRQRRSSPIRSGVANDYSITRSPVTMTDSIFDGQRSRPFGSGGGQTDADSGQFVDLDDFDEIGRQIELERRAIASESGRVTSSSLEQQRLDAPLSSGPGSTVLNQPIFASIFGRQPAGNGKVRFIEEMASHSAGPNEQKPTASLSFTPRKTSLVMGQGSGMSQKTQPPRFQDAEEGSESSSLHSQLMDDSDSMGGSNANSAGRERTIAQSSTIPHNLAADVDPEEFMHRRAGANSVIQPQQAATILSYGALVGQAGRSDGLSKQPKSKTDRNGKAEVEQGRGGTKTKQPARTQPTTSLGSTGEGRQQQQQQEMTVGMRATVADDEAKNLYDRLVASRKKRDADIEKQRRLKEAEELNECLFRPVLETKKQSGKKGAVRSTSSHSHHMSSGSSSVSTLLSMGGDGQRALSHSRFLRRLEKQEEQRKQIKERLTERARMEEAVLCPFRPFGDKDKDCVGEDVGKTSQAGEGVKLFYCQAGDMATVLRAPPESCTSKIERMMRAGGDDECCFQPLTNPVPTAALGLRKYLSQDAHERLYQPQQGNNTTRTPGEMLDVGYTSSGRLVVVPAAGSATPQAGTPTAALLSPKKVSPKSADAYYKRALTKKLEHERRVTAQREAEETKVRLSAAKPKTDANSRYILAQRKARQQEQDDESTTTIHLLNKGKGENEHTRQDKFEECTDTMCSTNEGLRFSPIINPASRRRPARTLDDLVYGDALRKEDVRARCQEAQEAAIIATATFEPRRMAAQPLGVESKLKALLDAPRLLPPWMVRPDGDMVVSQQPQLPNARDTGLAVSPCSFKPEILPAPSIVMRINEEIRRQALLHNLDSQ